MKDQTEDYLAALLQRWLQDVNLKEKNFFNTNKVGRILKKTLKSKGFWIDRRNRKSESSHLKDYRFKKVEDKPVNKPIDIDKFYCDRCGAEMEFDSYFPATDSNLKNKKRYHCSDSDCRFGRN